ncbi:MAG: shikimate dehydrogenase [Verrucomicrobiota bacterium]
MPDQEVFTLKDLESWRVTGCPLSPPAKVAVFGDPVAHSLSPQLHNPALEAAGIDAQYIRIHLPVEDLKRGLDLTRELGFIGVNCTIPHKFEALKAVDEVDDLARRLGAVNTVVFEDGQALGFNSDGPGLVRALREEFSVDLHDLRVLIFGAGGGAGRAAAVQCAVEDCERLVLVNRTHEKAEALRLELAPAFESDRLLAQAERLEAIPWETEPLAESLQTIDLIINATSVGMKRTDQEFLPHHLVEPSHLVYDMIYSPPRTKLLQAAENEGARTANGLSMLLHQGAISFEHWFNREAPLEAMRDGLRSSI